MHPARGSGAVGVTGWVAMAVGALGFMSTVVPIGPLVSICAIPAVRTAG
jgi:hypothetical protein